MVERHVDVLVLKHLLVEYIGERGGRKNLGGEWGPNVYLAAREPDSSVQDGPYKPYGK